MGGGDFRTSPKTHLLVVVIVSLSLLAAVSLSQDTASSIAQCVPQLLPLAPCGPYVQGSARSPNQPCCDNLKQIYAQQPQCLCMLLNNSAALSSLPINSSLAFQLPLLCSLQVDISVCSPSPRLNGSSSSAPQVSLGSTGASPATDSTIPAPPVFQPLLAPPNNGTEQGLGKSGGTNLKNRVCVFVVLVIVISTLI